MVEEKLLTVDEVAKMLCLDVTTVYQLVWRRRIPSVKISRRCVRFDPAAIKNWLAEKAQPVQPVSEPQQRQRKGRQKKTVSSSYVDSIVEAAKKEVTCKQ